MPNSSQVSTMGWMLLVPCRCPTRRGRWRRCAQRPLPSMMIATWRGTASGRACAGVSLRLAISNRHDLRLLGPANGVEFGDDTVGDLLQALLRPFDLVG